MKKIIIGIMFAILLTSLVLAMNIRISSWSPKYDSTRNYTLIVNQGDNLDKVCSLGIFSLSCYMSEWSSSDLADYNLDVSCEGTGCQFMKNIPAETMLLVQGTKYKYNWAMNIPSNAELGTYDISLCGTISTITESGGIGISLSACNNDKFTINGTYIKPVCQENWKCTSWRRCRKHIQTRYCYDANKCKTIINKPIITRRCLIWKTTTMK